MCNACHRHWTDRPIEWEDFCKKILGEQNYQELRMLAIKYVKIDYMKIMNDLHEAKKSGKIYNTLILKGGNHGD